MCIISYKYTTSNMCLPFTNICKHYRGSSIKTPGVQGRRATVCPPVRLSAGSFPQDWGLGGIDSEASYVPDSNETHLGLPPLALFSSGPFGERSVCSQLSRGESRGEASLLRGVPMQGPITPHSETEMRDGGKRCTAWLDGGGRGHAEGGMHLDPSH